MICGLSIRSSGWKIVTILCHDIHSSVSKSLWVLAQIHHFRNRDLDNLDLDSLGLRRLDLDNRDLENRDLDNRDLDNSDLDRLGLDKLDLALLQLHTHELNLQALEFNCQDVRSQYDYQFPPWRSQPQPIIPNRLCHLPRRRLR